MEEKSSKHISKFFTKDDIEFLKKINSNNDNLEVILNQPLSKEDDTIEKECVIKEKYK